MTFDNELNSYILGKQRDIPGLIEDIKDFNHRDEYYKIRQYIDDFLNDDKGGTRFVVMPGLRGVGKTTILLQIYSYLLNEKKIHSNNILFLPMDNLKFYDIPLLDLVERYLQSSHKRNLVYLDKKIFILVDECHFDKNWALAGKILYDNSEKIFLVFTGSSALNLELNPDVSRRSFKEKIFPNNFRDHLLLKYDIDVDYKFSKALGNIIYCGDEKYIEKGIELEIAMNDKLIKLKRDPKIEFREFLKEYGFPVKLNSEKIRRVEEINGIINKVIEKDVPHLKTFNGSTNSVIRKLIYYMALNREGSLSNHKIANYLNVSSKLVNEILNVLEKTQLLFPVTAYGGGSKVIKKPWKYYFLSPSLKAAVNFEYGRFNLDKEKCIGSLAENYVASAIFKLSQTRFPAVGLFYPSDNKGSDFIIKTKVDERVAIEVGIGKKTKSQLSYTMNEYDCERGILISNRYNRIKNHNDITYIPLMSFGFI